MRKILFILAFFAPISVFAQFTPKAQGGYVLSGSAWIPLANTSSAGGGTFIPPPVGLWGLDGSTWAPCTPTSCGGGGGGAVSSVFGRTGAVVAVSGDYTAAQVTNAAATNAANTFTATNTQASGTGTQYLATGNHTWEVLAGATNNQSAFNFTDITDGQVFGSLFGFSNGRLVGFFLPANNGTQDFCFGFTSSGNSYTGTPDTLACRSAAGVWDFGTSNTSPNGAATIHAKLYQAGVGTQITAAATIAPTFAIHHITGTTSVTTITPPANFASGQITLIPDDATGQTTGTGGNIALATVMVQNKALILTWDGTKWYPSY